MCRLIAVIGYTALEIIYERADSDRPLMGLITFSWWFANYEWLVVDKNYLIEEELNILNNLISGYFYFAEIQSIRHRLRLY